MSSHRTPLQRGVSLPEFADRFGSEEQCIEQLMRWVRSTQRKRTQ